MKPFVVLLFFITFLVLFAGAAMGDTDLTPNTAPAPVTGGSSSSAVQGVRSSACTDPYIVRSGDTLSGIARLCAVSLADLLAANSGIANPDLIQIDQQIRIPGGGSAPPAAQPTSAPQPTAPPRPTPTATARDAQPTPVPTQENQPLTEEELRETKELEGLQTASAP